MITVTICVSLSILNVNGDKVTQNQWVWILTIWLKYAAKNPPTWSSPSSIPFVLFPALSFYMNHQIWELYLELDLIWGIFVILFLDSFSE